PRPVPRRAAAVRRHLRGQHRRRAGPSAPAAALCAAVRGDAMAMFARRRRTDLLGQTFTWLCGGALAFNLLLALGLLLLIATYGLGFFWQKRLVLLTLADGSQVLGEVHEREAIPPGPDQAPGDRIRLKVGNRDLYGLDFRWVDERDIARRDEPAEATL